MKEQRTIRYNLNKNLYDTLASKIEITEEEQIQLQTAAEQLKII